MADHDLAVRGGLVVTPRGRSRCDVLVAGGRISAVVPSGRDAPSARASFDASGLMVLPGMVDTHVHLMEPGDASREDFPTGSAAAACNGVTTIVEHTHSWPVTDSGRLAEKRSLLEGRSWVDYGLAAHIWADEPQDLAALWRGGATFFKLFTCATHGVPAAHPDTVVEVFDELARLGAPALVHCEDDHLTAAAERRLRQAGREDPGIVPEWRSREAELVAAGTVALLARLSGAAVTLAHVSCPAVLSVLADQHRHGGRAVAETCPQYLFLREDEVYEHGAFRKFTPPARLRNEADAQEMWAAFNSGAIHHLSTDHAPATAAQKQAGDLWSAHFGLPGLDTTLALMLDAALTGATSLEQVVALYAQAPARRYGLAGKGRIAPGADADLALVDPSATRVLSDEAVRSRAGWTPYAGRAVRGAVVATFLRGALVADATGPVGAPGGRFIPGPGSPPS